MDGLATRPRSPGRIVPPWAMALVAGSLLVSGTPAVDPDSRLSGQVPSLEQRAGAEGFSLEITPRFRWMYGRQRPEFTIHQGSRRVLHIDSIQPGIGGAIASYHFSERWADGRVDVASDGRVLSVEGQVEPPMPRWQRSGLDSLNSRFLRYFEPSGRQRIRLPETRGWELVPVVASSTPLAAGITWVDTLDFATELDGFAQALSGIRHTTVVGDSVVQGSRLWILVDSAVVEYRERFLTEERTLGAFVATDREARGVVRGTTLYDPALGLARLRHDTTSLRGEARLSYPDGREFITPARFEETRAIVLHDPSSLAARDQQLRDDSRRQRAGMLILPSTEAEERLRAGDAEVVDSLMALWRGSIDPDERASLHRALTLGSTGIPGGRRALEEMLLAEGDTAAYHGVLDNRVMGLGGGLDADDWGIALRFMEDPGLAFGFGVSRDVLYENARQGMLGRPPNLTPDEDRWTCRPDVCEAMAAQWDEAAEPRLRELGLMTRLLTDDSPQGWADSILVRAESGSAFLQPVAEFVAGVGATWPAAARAPIPSEGADWRLWSHWMNGSHPSYPNPRPDPVRFMETHVNAIRFHELLTGRDIARELGAISLDSAPDTARLVVGTVLRGLGAAAVDPELVAELFRSESEADRQLAAGSISSLFAGAEPAATGVADQLMDRLLGAVIEGRDVWFPQLHGQEAGQRGTDIGRFSGERDDSAPRFLLKETLSATILSRWEDRVVLVDPAEWSARSSRLAATLYQPREVLRVGPFVRIGIDYTTRMDRAADEAPAGYAGGYTAYLLQTDEGWRVVATSIWIT